MTTAFSGGEIRFVAVFRRYSSCFTYTTDLHHSMLSLDWAIEWRSAWTITSK